MTALAGWERRLAEDLRTTLLARLGDNDEDVRAAAATALAGAAGEAEVRAALLVRLGDDAEEFVRRAAAETLGAWVAAEKFGRQLGDIEVVLPAGE